MAESLKINITIAGRVYPVVVKNEIEEEGMRKAAKKINELVTKFEKEYEVNDKQDVLSMCALQFASLVEIKAIKENEDTIETEKKLNEISDLLSKYLN